MNRLLLRYDVVFNASACHPKRYLPWLCRGWDANKTSYTIGAGVWNLDVWLTITRYLDGRVTWIHKVEVTK